MKTTHKLRNIHHWLITLLSGSFLAAKSKAATLALQSEWISDTLSHSPRQPDGEVIQTINAFGNTTLASSLNSAATFPEPVAYALFASGIFIILLLYRHSRRHIIKELRKKKVTHTLCQYIRTDIVLPTLSQISDTRPQETAPSLPKRRWDRITQNVPLVKNHPYETHSSNP